MYLESEKCKVKHTLYASVSHAVVPFPPQRAMRFIITEVLMLFRHLTVWGGDHQRLYSWQNLVCWTFIQTDGLLINEKKGVQ